MSESPVQFDPKNMLFRRLGSSGLRVPVFSIGGWLTIGGTVNGDKVKEIIKTAFDNGINFFDNAEAYANGNSEIEMGNAFKDLNLLRSDIIVSTKIYWGTKSGPNAKGLSRKHIIEGTKASLKRLQLEYVDIIFAHRHDPTVPIEEIVRAFNWVIEKGYALYWGTSEWSAYDIEAAHNVANKLGLIAPVADQCQHHMFHRERPEKEYSPLYQRYNYGTTVWSALAGGLLTGKYNDGVPEDSRFAVLGDQFKDTVAKFKSEEGQKQIAQVRELTSLAKSELDCSPVHLALAWVLKRNPYTSTVILGASKPEQVIDNLKALDVLPKLTPEILKKIDDILGNAPKPILAVNRDPLYEDSNDLRLRL